jgi:hypothetical protein
MAELSSQISNQHVPTQTTNWKFDFD